MSRTLGSAPRPPVSLGFPPATRPAGA